MGVT
jgi:hypothetical protein